MQTTMTVQENGLFIPVSKNILEAIKANKATHINYGYSQEWGFFVTPVSVSAEKPTLAESDFESENIADVLQELAQRKDLTISPEVAKLAGSLKPSMMIDGEVINEEEQAFLQAVNADDERIKAYEI